MNIFWKTVGTILVAVVLALCVGKQEKDLAMVLTTAAAVMTLTAAFSYLDPVLSLLRRLESLGGLQPGVLDTLLKITGIGLVSEVAATICQDSGNGALAKGMQLLGTALILSLSVPLFETLLELVQHILGEI